MEQELREWQAISERELAGLQGEMERAIAVGNGEMQEIIKLRMSGVKGRLEEINEGHKPVRSESGKAKREKLEYLKSLRKSRMRIGHKGAEPTVSDVPGLPETATEEESCMELEPGTRYVESASVERDGLPLRRIESTESDEEDMRNVEAFLKEGVQTLGITDSNGRGHGDPVENLLREWTTLYS